MAMNRVQFQRGLSLPQFLEQFGTEEQCQDALLKARWPQGFACPACQYRKASRFVRGCQTLWQCQQCRVQTSLTAGTPLAGTKLPLRLWWLAIYLVAHAKNGIAAMELGRQLGVCYRTAWRLKHKVMAAMTDREAGRQLAGLVQIDDAYLGGERSRGTGAQQWENKVPFIAAVSTRAGRPQQVRFDCVPHFQRQRLKEWAEQALSPGASIVSDGLTAFIGVTWAGVPHEAIVSGGTRKAAQQPRLRWVNTILSNLKTSLSGTQHAIKFAKYGPRYLGAYQYRFNRRFDLPALIPRLAVALIRHGPLTEGGLRAVAEIRR